MHRSGAIKPAAAPSEHTDLERGLEKAIRKDLKSSKAFENLVRNGYASNDLLIDLTIWARTPRVLFAETLGSKIPSRDAKNRLISFVQRLRDTATEMESNKFQLEVRDEGQLNRHWIIKKNGEPEAADRIRRLPETLRLYAKLLKWQLLADLRLAKMIDKTYIGYQKEQTLGFANEVRKRTKKDRLDSVVPLLKCASQYFHLNKQIEKKALSQQLKRLRERSISSS